MQNAKLWLATQPSTRCASAWPASSYSSVSSPYESTTAQAAGQLCTTGKEAWFLQSLNNLQSSIISSRDPTLVVLVCEHKGKSQTKVKHLTEGYKQAGFH